MTEAEWRGCKYPVKMLPFLQGPWTTKPSEYFGPQLQYVVYEQGLASDRKLRLFCVACCRRLWQLVDAAHCSRLLEFGNRFGRREVRWGLGMEPFTLVGVPLDSCHRAVEFVERAADEPADEKEWDLATEGACALATTGEDYVKECAAGRETLDSELMATGQVANAVLRFRNRNVYYDDIEAAILRLAQAVAYLRGEHQQKVKKGDKGERAAQADLLRNIFGPRPKSPIKLKSEWRTDTAVSLARTMYESREFSAMPILADALQDAGCDNEDILNHCRGDGPHVRGCWVVDLVLGKE
ncbi:MAG: hypothetical protein L0241_01040 [Planctomycetia bacterium]|nr:hypothetical protein [Planctomycetia bacterium]